MKILVSACLLGRKCKYNGGDNYSEKLASFLEGHEVIPVCPEVAGGLPVPRLSCEIVDGVVMNTAGESKDREYREGAARCLEVAKEKGADLAVLQSRSPSCGVRQIYDGTFSGKLKEGSGVFAALLRENGFRVMDAADLLQVEFRHYREEDYDAVCSFLIELIREDRSHVNWNWARFEWMYEHPYADMSLKEAIGLWTVKDRIVGAAIYDMYFGEAFCGVLQGYEVLFPAVLRYAFRELRDDEGLAIALCDQNAFEIEAAAAAGFTPEEQTETIMEKSLGEPLPVALPAGFSITEMDPEREGTDIRAFQWLFWQGFDHGDDVEAFEEDLRKTLEKGLRQRKHFDPRLSLAARDASGELVSYCCLWYNNQTDYAYVEPVCTVPAHRGKGLARALLYEAMNRAKAMGAKKAYVISDQEFYRRLGFEETVHYRFFRKK